MMAQAEPSGSPSSGAAAGPLAGTCRLADYPDHQRKLTLSNDQLAASPPVVYIGVGGSFWHIVDLLALLGEDRK